MKTILIALGFFSAVVASSGPDFKPVSFEKNSVQSQPGLWFSKTEVAIGEYDDFLDWLREQGRGEEAGRFIPDDSVWIRDLSFNDPYAKHYNHHEAFKSYPVVGVTQEAALAYCDYLTQRHGEIRLRGSDGQWSTVRVK